MEDATKAMIVAAIVSKRVCDSLLYETAIMCLYGMAFWHVFASGRTLIRFHEIYANYWKNRDRSVFGARFALPKRDLSPFSLQFTLSFLSN